MTVDIHTHVFCPKLHFGERLRADLANCGIDPGAWGDVAERHLSATQTTDLAVVFGIQGKATGWNVPNDFVAEHAQRAPDRLLFFASVDPTQPGFREELERCHRLLHCQGLKLAPIYQGIHPLDPRCREVYSYCERNGLPIIIHMAATFSRGVPLEFARPAHIDQVAIDYPDLKLVLPHLGHPWEGETIVVIRRNPNVYADISALHGRPWQFYQSMRLLVEYRAWAKVLFGSDFPFSNPDDSLRGLRSVNSIASRSSLELIPENVIEEIIHCDALHLLGCHMAKSIQPGKVS
jgi:uncharacterized protein